MEKPEWEVNNHDTGAQWLDADSTVPVLDGVPIHKWSEMSPEWRTEHGLPPTSVYRQSMEEDLANKERWEAERLRPPSWRRQRWRDKE